MSRAVHFNADGLVPVITQDVRSHRVLMLAWANEAALRNTLDTRTATYFSRSRQELWVKGATSGNTQRVERIEIDCDGDTLLYLVEPAGPACHTGQESCFDTGVLLSEGAEANS